MDNLTTRRRTRTLALKVFGPIHRLAAELEWQLTRLTTWLSDDQ